MARREEEEFAERPQNKRRYEDDDDVPRRRSRRTDDDWDERTPRRKRDNSTSALVWILIGSGAALLLLVFVFTAFVWPGFLRSGTASTENDPQVLAKNREASADNLRQIGIAFHDYHSDRKRFPSDLVDKDLRPLLSWRVQILPYVGEERLYRKFNLDLPWDHPTNKALLTEMPSVYLAPGHAGGKGLTHYQGFAGVGTALARPGAGVVRDVMITDGLSNTLLVVEADEAVEWTKPADIAFDPDGPPVNIRGTLSPGGFNACFANGAVKFVRTPCNPGALRAAITRNGGEVGPPLD
jgi:Protein of unknown function (DUF1559)